LFVSRIHSRTGSACVVKRAATPKAVAEFAMLRDHQSKIITP